MGVSIARRTRSGSGVGPGMCKKCRPTGREEFLAIGSLLLKQHLLLGFRGLATGAPSQGAALVALNYECNIAVKQFSARQPGPLRIGLAQPKKDKKRGRTYARAGTSAKDRIDR